MDSVEKRLDGRTVLITGGASGIGAGCARRFAAYGADIAVCYSRNKDRAEELVQELTGKGTTVMAVQADVADQQQVASMVQQVQDRYGRIDVLINSAGRTSYVSVKDLDGITDEDWDMIMDTNLRGTFYVSRACGKSLRANKGCIVNISSRSGVTGSGSSLPYSASKGALITMTKTLARALAPEVRVNAVAPGVIMTDWVAGQDEHIRTNGMNNLLERLGQVEDVVEVVESLVLRAGFVTGQTLVIDGGRAF